MVILSSGDTQSRRLSLLDKTLQNFEPKANSTVLLNQSMFMDVSPVDGDVLDKLPMFDLNTSPTDNKPSPLSELSPLDNFLTEDSVKQEKNSKANSTVFCNSPMEMATPLVPRMEKKVENTYNMSLSMDLTLQDKKIEKKIDGMLDLSSMSMDISSEELRLDKTKKDNRILNVENFFSNLTKAYDKPSEPIVEKIQITPSTIDLASNENEEMPKASKNESEKRLTTERKTIEDEKLKKDKEKDKILEKINVEISSRDKKSYNKTSPVRLRKMMSTPCIPNPNAIDLSLSVIDGPENEKVDLITPQVVEETRKGETVSSRTMSYVRAALKEEQQTHKENQAALTKTDDKENMPVEKDLVFPDNKQEKPRETYFDRENQPARNKWGGENFYDELDALSSENFHKTNPLRKTKYSLGDIQCLEDNVVTLNKSEKPIQKRGSVPSSFGNNKKESYQMQFRDSVNEKSNVRKNYDLKKITPSKKDDDNLKANLLAVKEDQSTSKDSENFETDAAQRKVDATFVINPSESNKEDEKETEKKDKIYQKTTEMEKENTLEDVEISLGKLRHLFFIVHIMKYNKYFSDMEESSKFALSENSLLTDDSSTSLIKLPKLPESFLVKSALHSSCRKGQLSEEQKKWRRVLVQLKDDQTQHEEDLYVWGNALRKDKSLRMANEEISRLRSNRQRTNFE